MDQVHGNHSMPSPYSPGYLPQYLLGSNSPAASPISRGRPSSSLGSYRGSSQMTGGASSISSPRHYNQFGSPLTSQGIGRKLDKTSARTTPTIGRTPKDSISAPPVEGLYDTTDVDITSSLFSREQPMDVSMVSAGTTTLRKNIGGNVTMSGMDTQHFSPQHSGPFPSPTQIDPFYTQGDTISSDDNLDECWVTVFGFPPAASSFILQQFSQYGNIVRSKVSRGNWLHIQYQSKLQAKKALSKNGKVYSNDIMVGVVPCIEKSVMEAYGKENMPSSAVTDDLPAVASKPTPIRPLTAAYQAAISDHQVVPGGGRTPQKDSNIISKAMEYMFGW